MRNKKISVNPDRTNIIIFKNAERKKEQNIEANKRK